MSQSLSIARLLANFESLGNNCEFGIVMKAGGFDPPGLFRNVGLLKTMSMIRAVETSFDGMFDDGNFAFSVPDGWPDYSLHCKKTGMGFHTGIPAGEAGEPAFRKNIESFRFLKRKFLEDLREARKIFVYRHNEQAETTDVLAARLLAALRKHGPNWLLFVKEDVRPDRRFAWAEAGDEGLIRGGIPYLSKENPPQINFAAWEKITQQALNIRDRVVNGADWLPDELRTVATETVVLHRLAPQRSANARNVHQMQFNGLEQNSVCTAEAEIYVPDAFRGSGITLTMPGCESQHSRGADLSKRAAWQTISVSAQLPGSTTRAAPALAVAAQGTDETWLCSRGWKLRTGRPRRKYKTLWCDELLQVSPDVAVVGRSADIDLELARIAFGQVSRPNYPITEYPPGGWEETRISARNLKTIELKNAEIHGEQGVVTVGDYLLKDTIRLASFKEYEMQWEGGGDVSFERFDPKIGVALGSHLFCGHPGNHNYAHWLVDVLPGAFAPFVDKMSTLIWPRLRHDWQKRSLSLLDETHRSMFLEGTTSVRCDRLRISPLGLIDSGHLPHPDRMALINHLKARVGFDPERRRRLYVSRQDSVARQLANEDSVIDYLEAQGFEILKLTGMPIEKQIRYFAEAECVVGPHGAGLANVIFCPPGATFCELLMDSYVQWSMRRLASVVPLRYGCVIGREQGVADEQYRKKWTVDLAAVVQAIRAAVAGSAPVRT